MIKLKCKYCKPFASSLKVAGVTFEISYGISNKRKKTNEIQKYIAFCNVISSLRNQF